MKNFNEIWSSLPEMSWFKSLDWWGILKPVFSNLLIDLSFNIKLVENVKGILEFGSSVTASMVGNIYFWYHSED